MALVLLTGKPLGIVSSGGIPGVHVHLIACFPHLDDDRKCYLCTWFDRWAWGVAQICYYLAGEKRIGIIPNLSTTTVKVQIFAQGSRCAKI